MTTNQQLIHDELLRQWQPYGPVAAFWAVQLANAMFEFECATAVSPGMDDPKLKLWMRRNDHALRRINMVQRTLNAIKREPRLMAKPVTAPGPQPDGSHKTEPAAHSQPPVPATAPACSVPPTASTSARALSAEPHSQENRAPYNKSSTGL